MIKSNNYLCNFTRNQISPRQILGAAVVSGLAALNYFTFPDQSQALINKVCQVSSMALGSCVEMINEHPIGAILCAGVIGTTLLTNYFLKTRTHVAQGLVNTVEESNAPPTNWGIVRANCENPDVYLLEDIHTDKASQKARREFIEQHIQEGDVVLVESKEKNFRLNPEKIRDTKNLKCKVTVFGWDNLEALAKANQLTGRCVEVGLALEELELEGNSNEMIQAKQKELNTIMNEMEHQDLVIRNQSLLDSIKTTYQSNEYSGKRIFVIAGEAHYNKLLINSLELIKCNERPIQYHQIQFQTKKEEVTEEEKQKYLRGFLTETDAAELKNTSQKYAFPPNPIRENEGVINRPEEKLN